MAKIGPSYCQDCGKRTYLTEEAVQQRIRDTLLLYGHFLSAYRCPARTYGFHVRNIEKRLARGGKDGERSKLKREYTLLLQELERHKDSHPKVAAPSEVAARRALDAALWRLPRGAPGKRRKHNKFRRPERRYRRGDPARVGLPRGELVTKMLSWANSSKFHVSKDGDRPRGDGDAFRRRNRAREAEAVRREITREMPELTCVEIGCHPRFHDRTWSMNDEYAAPSTEVWRTLAENEELERTLPVDYDGTWTCG